MGSDWKIKPRSTHCCTCNTPFSDRQKCYSILTYGEEGYSRSDHCESCWQTVKPTTNALSVWQSIYTLPPPPTPEPIKKETAESLLRQLITSSDESSTNVVYILAIMLERKKIFVERDTHLKENGVIVRLYEHKKTGEVFAITDPNFQLDKLIEVQRQLVAMLSDTDIPNQETVAEQSAS